MCIKLHCTAIYIITLSTYNNIVCISLYIISRWGLVYTHCICNCPMCIYRGFVTNLMIVIIKYYIRNLTRPVKLKTCPRGNCTHSHSFSFTDLVRWWHNCQCTWLLYLLSQIPYIGQCVYIYLYVNPTVDGVSVKVLWRQCFIESTSNVSYDDNRELGNWRKVMQSFWNYPNLAVHIE